MKKLIASLFTVLSTVGCINVESKQPLTSYEPVERYADLLWVEQANPVSDALQALKQEDKKLWAYNTRTGPQIPGVNTDAVSTVLKKHQLKIAPSMGGVVYGNQHLELRLKFIKYAQRYNQEILNSQ
jgi:hypothetical protein